MLRRKKAALDRIQDDIRFFGTKLSDLIFDVGLIKLYINKEGDHYESDEDSSDPSLPLTDTDPKHGSQHASVAGAMQTPSESL